MTQEVLLRTNPTSDKPSRGPDRRPAVWKDFPESPASIDKHCKKQSTEGSLEISKEKAATNFLVALMWRGLLNIAILASPTHKRGWKGCPMGHALK